jgi:pimeloyl-ACP methyl ester carboxylesterase
MNFRTFGKKDAPVLILIPGLGVSFEIFTPLMRMLEDKFHIIAVEVDGFTLGKHTAFTSVDDQAGQIIGYIKGQFDGKIECAYGLSLGGKILSRVLERGEVAIGHSVMDAAPLLPLPGWMVKPLSYTQAANVWSCYHWTRFWRWVFHSHYFDMLLNECRKVYPYGGVRSVLDGYQSVYTSKLESIPNSDIHYWYGTKEAFVAKYQVDHLRSICPSVRIEIFDKMNHGQLLIDHPEEIARRIEGFGMV